jgi:hypothetical protein
MQFWWHHHERMTKEREEEHSIERLPATRLEFSFERPHRKADKPNVQTPVVVVIVSSIAGLTLALVGLVAALIVGRISEAIFVVAMTSILTALGYAFRVARKVVRKR